MLRTRIYYRVKPFIPTAIRTAVRRTVAARLRSRVGDVWPIMPGSERPPVNWPGWPEGKKFAFVLTHDVEGTTGLNKCRALMRLEQEFGLRSSFNFIPEGPYRVPATLRDELRKNGFEVGVHDLKHDGSLYRSKREFSQSAARINRYLSDWNASGFRSGFMLHNLDWLHEIDIAYDASTFDTDPFEPQPEGRNTVFPFWMPRPSRSEDPSLNGRVAGYVELPYTLPQDSTLFLLLRENSPEIWLRKLDWLAKHGGMALVNIHPDYIDFSSGRAERTTYPLTHVRELLKYVCTKYADQFWNPLPNELSNWFRCGHEPKPAVEPQVARPSAPKSPRVVYAPNLAGKRAAVLLYSYYPADPRPRRAAEALASRGMQVDLICLRENEADQRNEEVNGVRVLRLPWRKTRDSKLAYIRQYGTFIAGCFGLLTARSFKQRYDLVHVHNMPDVLVFAAIVPKLLGARIILDLHDPMPELMMSIYNVPEAHRAVAWLKAFERWSIRFADLVFTPNVAFRKLFISRGAPETKIEIVMNSPQEEIFDSAAFGRSDQSTRMPSTRVPAAAGQNGSRHVQPTQTQTFYLMYHGSLVHRHGLDIAVRALAEVRHTLPFVQLDIFGYRTDYLDSVLNLAKKLGLDDVVAYHGAKPQTEIARNILQCDLGIIPNRYSPFTDLNFPTRIFEYLAMNRPVIAPSTQGIRDYFPDDALIYFNPDLVDSLAKSIRWVWENPREVREIVERGRAIYRRHLWKDEEANLREAVAALVSLVED
jgi:glycosyltransferase involved in cell wall biosynthesis